MLHRPSRAFRIRARTIQVTTVDGFGRVFFGCHFAYFEVVDVTTRFFNQHIGRVRHLSVQ